MIAPVEAPTAQCRVTRDPLERWPKGRLTCPINLVTDTPYLIFDTGLILSVPLLGQTAQVVAPGMPHHAAGEAIANSRPSFVMGITTSPLICRLNGVASFTWKSGRTVSCRPLLGWKTSLAEYGVGGTPDERNLQRDLSMVYPEFVRNSRRPLCDRVYEPEW